MEVEVSRNHDDRQRIRILAILRMAIIEYESWKSNMQCEISIPEIGAQTKGEVVIF